ncbi:MULTISPECIES: hypothetical protein [Lactobacillales]|uniref:Uncharacterized protein n=1 Tax=Enterococcus raffinosus TaxID=71452 RepID=A0AAW8T4N1_9ENTE|nr:MULTISPECIES: hypothetical protein [Enterococcus]EHV9021615.1 hypothetical protein [Listeria monocytogenes]EHV9021935.1 hypothetical protein [Listeria monocytogenes]MBA5256229.1 hypothetical protein [Enterococcus hirae]MDB1684444.1 hypothetical protein [Enterococcus durans]MDT2544238.1 hypothetical protein [Enterococcus raffinosus]
MEKRSISVDVSSGIYGAGFLFAAGMHYATYHSLLSAIIHGLLSWAYVGYWIVDFLTK